MKRTRVAGAIVVVAILAGAAALVWFRSRPRWVLRDVGAATITPSGELLVATNDPSAPESETGIPHEIIARLSANGARTPIAKAYGAGSLVASSSHVFWAERGLRGPTRVRGAPLAGGDATDFGESMAGLRGLTASNDRVYWLKETGAVMTAGDKEIAHDTHCIAADDAGAFAATDAGVVRLDTGEVVFQRATTSRCALLLSANDVFLATWLDTRESTIERAPRAGGAFVKARTERNVATWWWVVGSMFVWTSVESLGKGRDGYERTSVLTHVARGSERERVVAHGDTMWVGMSGDTLYLLELDGLRAVTLR